MKKKKGECKHETVFYYPSINEDGWKCLDCGDLGFRPDLDKSHIYSKVMGILMDMCEKKLIYVSNGTQGDIIRENVASICLKKGAYDQYSIILEIMKDWNVGTKGHSTYWKKKSKEYFKELK